MKDFIVAAAILPLLLLFLMQFAADCQRNEKLEIVQNIVYTAKETAKQEGRFSKELQEKVASEISTRLGIPRESVEITAQSAPKSRFDDDHDIAYKVTVRLEGVMAGADIFGISREENVCTYIIDSYTASEYAGGV